MNKRIIPFLLLLLSVVATGPVHAADGGVENLRQTSKAFAAVARAVSPAVVFIQVEGRAASPQLQPFPAPFGEEWPFGDDLFRHFFGQPLPGVPGMTPRRPQPPQRRVLGQGSGFVFAVMDGLLADKAYILTNNHVVANAEKIASGFRTGVNSMPKSPVAIRSPMWRSSKSRPPVCRCWPWRIPRNWRWANGCWPSAIRLA